MRRTLLAAACALATLAAPRLPAQIPALHVESCTLPGVGTARCGDLRVRENRAAGSGRTIPIHFVVIPATGTAARDAVVPIAGGPGQSVTNDAGGYAEELRGLRDTRDVLLVDQRGTGGSNLLGCSMYGPDSDLRSYLGAFYPADRVARCAREWAGKADVTQYTSDAAADDLDEVRAALGYDRLDLYGGSYGTRAALVYMRRHPGHVRAAVLHGVTTTDARMPLHTAPDAERAMLGVLGECEREAACNAAFPHLRDDLRAVIDRLARGPVDVTVIHPVTGEPTSIPLTRELFAEGLRYMTYSGGSASMIPAVLHQAARGDLGPAAEQALFGRREIVNDGSHGVYLAVTCSEDVPFFSVDEGERAASGTFLGAYRVHDQKAACRAWPHRAVSRAFLEPVRSDAPVLILTGEWDPATPPYAGDQVLRTLPNGRHLVVPSGAHAFDGLAGADTCITPLIVRFIRTADAKGLDASCISAIHRPPFPTRALASTPVALREADLAPFTGSYTADSGFHMEIRLAGGRLHFVVPDGRDIPLAAVGPTRFRFLGSPFTYVAFVREGGSVTAFQLEEGGGPPQTFRRQ